MIFKQYRREKRLRRRKGRMHDTKNKEQESRLKTQEPRPKILRHPRGEAWSESGSSKTHFPARFVP